MGTKIISWYEHDVHHHLPRDKFNWWVWDSNRGYRDGENQSEEDNSPNSLWCSWDLSLSSLCLKIPCILINLPEAVVSRQPIKSHLWVGTSTSCTFWEGYFFSSPLSTPSSLCRLTFTYTQKHILFCVLSAAAPSAPQLSTSVYFNTLLFSVQIFRLSSTPLFYFSDLTPIPALFISFFGCVFLKGDSCFHFSFPHWCHPCVSKAEQDKDLLLRLRCSCMFKPEFFMIQHSAFFSNEMLLIPW